MIPLLGFFLAPVMVMRCVTIRRQVGSGWNPAAQHLRLGFWVSIIAFFYQLLIAVALVVVVPNLDDACNTSSGR